MIRTGTLLSNAPSYAEGTEPVPAVLRTGAGNIVVFNFSDQSLEAGISIRVVLDAFQRFIYHGTTRTQVIVSGQTGQIEEPVTSSPYREYLPSFVPTDDDGKFIAKERRDTNPGYTNHLSAGLVRLRGKKYAPIQATYQGGEAYLNSNGELVFRERGTLRYTRTGLPQYLLGRQVSRDDRYFAKHTDFFLTKNSRGRNSFLSEIRSDSPFQGEYLDGRPCHFDIKPIPIAVVFPEEWELTTDFKQAQYDFDICLAPDAADGECFVKGEELCFERKIAFTKVPRYTPYGQNANGEWYFVSGRWELLNGTWQWSGGKWEYREYAEKWQWAGYTYYEAIPPRKYYEPLRGQGKTEGFYFKSLPRRIEEKTVDAIDEPGVSEYVRLELVPGTGLPALHNEERVCRMCEYAPSRGVFYKLDDDGLRYPIIVTPDTSEGYGVETASSHTAYNEIEHQCESVVEHKQHNLVRDGHELLLSLEDDCWRQCGKIEGTIPPDLGDPRAVAKRSIFVELNTSVSGELPGAISLASGEMFNLATGEVV